MSFLSDKMGTLLAIGTLAAAVVVGSVVIDGSLDEETPTPSPSPSAAELPDPHADPLLLPEALSGLAVSTNTALAPLGVDGDTETAWEAKADAPFPQRYRVKLDGYYLISGVDIVFGGGCHRYTLQGLSELDGWVDIGDTLSCFYERGDETLVGVNQGPYNSFRVRFDDGDQPEVYELRLYGLPAPESQQLAVR